MEKQELEQLVKEQAEEIQELKEKVQEHEKQLEHSIKTDSSTADTPVSRRDFLKGLGGAAAGLGALALTPAASALDLRSNQFSFYNLASGGKQLELTQNGNLNLQGNNIQNTGSITTEEVVFATLLS